jgi:uncharacterized membrane protein YraQ (UPF0718 family)
VIDRTLVTLLVVLGVLCLVALRTGGMELLRAGLGGGAQMLVRFSLLLVVSFLAAGLSEVLVPREWVARALGEGSGLRGILLGAGVGALMPAGPFVVMPVAAAMVRAGASAGPVVAFLTGWALLAIHRLVAWELPLLGPRLAVLRYGVSLALPVAAGLLARAFTRS